MGFILRVTSDQITAVPASAARLTALARRSPVGFVIVRADSGSKFRECIYGCALREQYINASKGRGDSGGDNAAVASVQTLLQHNILKFGPRSARGESHYAMTC